jgi:EAL domain-containing protein (putative c-di-GMP-specific phosphodiesterase class I)
VRLALDDFGTGFSSLAHLRHLPIDILKIDKTFVDDLDSGERETSLAHVVHSLGARLRLVTIAEGVERKKQVDQLRALGCRLAQGYLFGRPQPADAFAMRLSNEHVSGGPLLGARGDIRLS